MKDKKKLLNMKTSSKKNYGCGHTIVVFAPDVYHC